MQKLVQGLHHEFLQEYIRKFHNEVLLQNPPTESSRSRSCYVVFNKISTMNYSMDSHHQPSGISIRNFSVDFVQKIFRGFHKKTLWGFPPQIPSRICSRVADGLLQEFLKDLLWDFPPRMPPRIPFRNFSGDFIMKFLQVFYLEISSVIFSENYFIISFNYQGVFSNKISRDLHQEFLLGFPLETFPSTFLWGLTLGIPLGVSSRDFLQDFYGIFDSNSSGGFVQIFIKKFLRWFSSEIPSVFFSENLSEDIM